MKSILKTKIALKMKMIYTRQPWSRRQSWRWRPWRWRQSWRRRHPWRWRQSWECRLSWRWKGSWRWSLSMQGCALASLRWSNCQCNNLRMCIGIFALDVHWLLDIKWQVPDFRDTEWHYSKFKYARRWHQNFEDLRWSNSIERQFSPNFRDATKFLKMQGDTTKSLKMRGGTMQTLEM